MEHQDTGRPKLAQLDSHPDGREPVLWKKTLCLGVYRSRSRRTWTGWNWLSASFRPSSTGRVE